MRRLLTLLLGFAAVAQSAVMAQDAATAENETATAAPAASSAPATQGDTQSTVRRWAEAVATRVKVTGYAQGGYEARFNEGADNTNGFVMKRAIVMVAANITPHFYAFFMHDFKGNNMQEYYLEYRQSRAFNVRLGQSKVELSIENPMSPRTLESVGCSSQGVAWMVGANPLLGNPSGRDMGLMVYGDLFADHLRYVLEVTNGGQINTADKNNQKNVVAKLEYSVVPNFKLSVSGQKGYGYAVATSAYNPGIALGETFRANYYSVGLQWRARAAGNDYYKHRCAELRAELNGGKTGRVKSIGAYASGSVPVYKGLDVVAEADYYNYNTALGIRNTNLMAGVQYWFFTKCRLQLQYTYSLPSAAKRSLDGLAGNYSQLQAQMQVSF